MQPASNGDFNVALKIDSQLTASAQQAYQGLVRRVTTSFLAM